WEPGSSRASQARFRRRAGAPARRPASCWRALSGPRQRKRPCRRRPSRSRAARPRRPRLRVRSHRIESPARETARSCAPGARASPARWRRAAPSARPARSSLLALLLGALGFLLRLFRRRGLGGFFGLFLGDGLGGFFGLFLGLLFWLLLVELGLAPFEL